MKASCPHSEDVNGAKHPEYCGCGCMNCIAARIAYALKLFKKWSAAEISGHEYASKIGKIEHMLQDDRMRLFHYSGEYHRALAKLERGVKP